jgi:carbamoyltransferase
MHTFDSTAARETFIAGTHPYDGTARLQMVSADINPRFHSILSKFSEKSGKAILLNTSFNLHGFPIVMGGRDAMDVMMRSGIEYLAVGNVLATKKKAP